jgi:hypothetical protein
MLARLRSGLTFANVVSLLALFVALSGGAYALTLPKNSVKANQIAKNAVGGSEIAKGAVRSAEVKDASLLRKDFRRGQLPAGERGPIGPEGPAGKDLRVLQGRVSAASDEVPILSWPAMGLEVRSHDASGDQTYQVRIANTNPVGGRLLYLVAGGSLTPVNPGADVAFGTFLGPGSALIAENGGAGRLLRLDCHANVNNTPPDDGFVQCSGLKAGPE